MQAIRIELDKVRHLRFNTNALAAFDDVNKVSFFALSSGAINYASIRNLVWAGLIHEDASLTPDIVGDLMDKHWFEKGKTLEQLFQIVTSSAKNDVHGTSKRSKKKAVTKKKATP